MKLLSSLLDTVKKAVPAILGNAYLRAGLGAVVTGAFATIGMHVSTDTVLALVSLGATLAGMGPHDPSGGGSAGDASANTAAQ